MTTKVATTPLTVLVVDSDASVRRALTGVLEAQRYRVITAADGATGLGILQSDNVDLVIADLRIAGITGEDLVVQLRQSYPDVPTIAMTAAPSVADTVTISRLGAAEYLAKPLDPEAVSAVVQAVLGRWAQQRQRRIERLAGGGYLRGITGRSRVMQLLYQQISRVAPAQVPILLTGETGTGKEIIAQALHRASGRTPFVPVNCSAIPDGLMESELFGHVRGAFTGADRDRVGLFEAAHGGTIFLDEIAELPLSLQAKLLRVLQSGELRRVGDVEPRHVTVRLIAATHRDLGAAVGAGAFREDLFYRINVLHLAIPALRERPTDVPLLAERFLSEIAEREQQPPKQLSPVALAHLVAYPWPGNVRQLQNVIQRVAILTDAEVIEVGDLPRDVRGTMPTNSVLQKLGTDLPLEEIEREHILGVLARVGGNRSRAARILGIPRRTLYRRLDEYGVVREVAEPLR